MNKLDKLNNFFKLERREECFALVIFIPITRASLYVRLPCLNQGKDRMALFVSSHAINIHRWERTDQKGKVAILPKAPQIHALNA